MCLIHAIGGAFSRRPEELDLKLSSRSADLVKRAFDNIDPHRLIDHHVHVAGLGIGGTRNLVNRKMRTWRHPFHRLKFKVYMSSAGVKDEARADEQLVERLAGLAREDLHERLVNGSDYPLPAVNILIRTRPLVKEGYISGPEGECLKEIYDYNPLLFDFVLKRTIKLPGTSRSLPASVFMTNAALGA